MSASIPQHELDDLQQAFSANPSDLGVGLCNPVTGETHVASFDKKAPSGHVDFATQLGLVPLTDWRGFVVTSTGRFFPVSQLNGPTLRMDAKEALAVEALLQQSGLVK